jgi:hypothetical protein
LAYCWSHGRRALINTKPRERRLTWGIPVGLKV